MPNGLGHSLFITFRIAQKDLLDFWKAKMLFATFMVMPLLFMSMFGFMFPAITATNNPYRNAPIAMVMEDDGYFAIDFADQFKMIASSTAMFTVKDFPSFLEHPRKRTKKGESRLPMQRRSACYSSWVKWRSASLSDLSTSPSSRPIVFFSWHQSFQLTS